MPGGFGNAIPLALNFALHFFCRTKTLLLKQNRLFHYWVQNFQAISFREEIKSVTLGNLWQVDSMLGRRENPGEHEAMRKMKNEFMVNWDGLRTKEKERILVLAATNRPFDLDEAVIRRLPRR